MSDLISRQAAIDALKSCYCGGEDSCGEPWIYESHAIKAIKQLPPIQPVNNSENPNSSDVISRQAAITQLSHNKNKGDDEWELAVENDIQTIWKLPSAHPEPFTVNLSDTLTPEQIERWKMQSLELLPKPEPCEDAVSRKAVKDGFVEMCSLICPYTEKQRHTMCGSCLLGTAFDVLEATQPVTPKQRTGHWHITDAYPHNVYCSECHKRFAQTHWAVWEDGSLPRNFCPNCGAKMEGAAE